MRVLVPGESKLPPVSTRSSSLPRAEAGLLSHADTAGQSTVNAASRSKGWRSHFLLELLLCWEGNGSMAEAGYLKCQDTSPLLSAAESHICTPQPHAAWGSNSHTGHLESERWLQDPSPSRHGRLMPPAPSHSAPPPLVAPPCWGAPRQPGHRARCLSTKCRTSSAQLQGQVAAPLLLFSTPLRIRITRATPGSSALGSSNLPVSW